MIASSVGRTRTFRNNPKTGQKESFWIIREEIYAPKRDEPPHDGGDWGKYYFEAWLEEDTRAPGESYLSFPYWRNDRFAGQYSLRAEPGVIRELFKQIQARGWLDK